MLLSVYVLLNLNNSAEGLFCLIRTIDNKLETMGRSRGKIRNKTKFQKKTWIAVALVIGYIIYAYLANIF
jgi:hypothetical protein